MAVIANAQMARALGRRELAGLGIRESVANAAVDADVDAPVNAPVDALVDAPVDACACHSLARPVLWCTGNLGLDVEPIHQCGVRSLERLLHEARHDHVAAHINVFTEVEACWRRPKTKLERLGRLARKPAADRPFVADVCNTSQSPPARPVAIMVHNVDLLSPAGA